MELDLIQRSAVEKCLDLTQRIVAITGPAGSGKTTIMRNAVQTLLDRKVTVALAAPTGKAARRIYEATGIPAVTIHKLLEFPRPGERDEETGKPLDTTVPKRGKNSPLPYKVLFIDEYAMVNHELNRYIIDALPIGGCIRAFGDINQLPPIEPYELKTKKQSAFQSYIDKNSITLEQVYRQGEGSKILEAANLIKAGRMPRDIRNDEIRIRFTDRPVSELSEFVLAQLDDYDIDYRKIENQIITPARISWIGTARINGTLKALLNPDAREEILLPRFKWQKDDVVRVGIGDKVVCTENTYDMRSYFDRFEQWTDTMRPVQHTFIPTPTNKIMLNGETGVVIDVRLDGTLEVDFGDRIVEIPASYEEYHQRSDTVYDADPRRQIELAYAMTTHKTQGSEYDHVTYIMNRSVGRALSRQNLYTAVTRARRSVMIFTDQSSFQTSLRKVKE